MKRIPALFLLICAVAASAGAQDFRRRERSFDALHYRIEVGFDEARQLVRGNTAITFRPLRPKFMELMLDAARMTVRRVALASGKELRFDYDSAKLTVHLDRAYAYGERATVTVRYECTPQRGLYFIQPNASYPKDRRQIWTQGQGEDNRHWFPCYDYPNDKATTEVLMTVRGEYTTLSNGVLKGKKKNADGTVTWHWSQEKPHSAYLVMLAAGDYAVYKDSWNGIPVHSYHYPEDAPENVRRAYENTAAMVRFFSERIGVRYPWAKYAQVPVAHYLYGGMENTTATVLADTRAVVDARTSIDYTADGLIAHELAHMWWGDYLTYIDWENAWLNEGFATYFQQCWTQHRWGEEEFVYGRREGVNGYLVWTDANGRVPVVTDKGSPSQNVYAKGASVLHMLRTMLGEEQFWRVIKTYAERFALSSVETNDFKRTIEAVTGMNLEWFFRQWLYKAGYPELRAERSWNESAKTLTLRFTQEQKTDSLCGYFSLHIPVFVHTAGGDTTFLARVEGKESTVTVPLPSRPLYISLDHGTTVCGRVRLEQSPEELLAQLREDSDPVRRGDAGIALLVQMDRADIRAAVFAAARGDHFWGVRVRLTSGLAGVPLEGLSWSGELRETLLALTHDAKSTVRANAVNGLNRLKDRALLPVFRGLLADSSYYVEAAAMNCIMTVDSTSSNEVVLERLEKRSLQDVLSLAAIEWATRYHIREARPALRRLAGPGGSPDLREKSLIALAATGVPRDTLMALAKAQLAEPVWQFRARAATALISLSPDEGAALLRERLAVESDERVGTHIRRLLEMR